MQRIWRGVAVLVARAQPRPIGQRDLAATAAVRDADRAAVLLRASHPIGEAIIRRDVVKLRRRLVVPTAPGRAIVHADDRALIGPGNHPRRIIGVNPYFLIIVAARRAFDRREALAAVGRTL